jgi:endonuclease/exonuclease/phosphatase family metal-dependent hydrolase
VRVLTWNLWWRFGPWEERQPGIAAVLRAEAPDVVLLQEVWAEEGGRHQAHELAAATGLHAVAADVPFRQGLAFCNAVLSRWPVLEAETVSLPNADGEPGHRHALVVRADAPEGPRLVVSAHLEWPYDRSRLRVAQATALTQAIAERDPAPEESAFPVVVGGDLNATPDSDEVRLLTGRTAGGAAVFQDAWEVAGPEGDPGWTWHPANPHLAQAAWPRRRLDYLLVRWPRRKPAGNVARCWLAGVEPIGGVVPSDHYAVVADFLEP